MIYPWVWLNHRCKHLVHVPPFYVPSSCVHLYICHNVCHAPTQIEDKEELGEWVGLCKIDKDGKPRKIVKCSCVVVKVTCLMQQAGT